MTDAGISRRRARYRHADEDTLLHWARGGDEDAFATLAERCGARLRAVCHRLCDDTGDAQDATQGALLSAWRHLERFAERSSFCTWLCAIGANAAKAIRRKPRPIPTDAEIELASVADDGSDHDDRHVRRQAVIDAVAALDPRFREPLVLREYGGLTYQEIAESLGLELNTVRTRINRARHRLAEQLLESS